MRAPLTERLLERLQRTTQEPLYVWDIHLKGLGARVARGGITFQIHRNGRRRSLGQIGLAKAREEFLATTLPANPARPLQPQIYPPSVDSNQAWRVYIESRGEDTRYWRELDARFKTHVLPGLELTKQGIRNVLATKATYPVAQRTLWEALGPFCKWLVSQDLISSNPMDGLLPPRVPKSRDRVLSDAELWAIWTACDRMPLWGPLFKLLLLTGQRRNEVAGMSYSEVINGVWAIPQERTKNNKAHLVHLSAPALDIINTRPRFIGANVSGFSKAKIILDRLSGIDNYRIHDFRRTAATGMASLGIEPHIIERILNHYQGSVYQRFEYLEGRKVALELWAAHLTTLGKR